MNNYFERVLLNAIINCEDRYCEDNETRKGFAKIYPFATENINGYLKYFDFINKKIATVGSSCDQIINFILKGAKDITIIDINPYTKFYFYLKKCALLCLDYEEFFEFFFYKDYPKCFKTNYNVFSKEKFDKMKDTLRLLDYESYLFWDELFSNFKGEIIRENLFSNDEYRFEVLKEMNNYLRNEKSYNDAKDAIKNVNPKFITGDILTIDIKDKFDNVILSNVGQYISIEELKNLIIRLDTKLNKDGKILICYLYSTTKNTKYKKGWAPIYDLNNNYKVFGEYITSIESFISPRGILFEDDNSKDSIMLYVK